MAEIAAWILCQLSVETTSVSLVVDTDTTSHPAFIHQLQYATLTSPNKGETLVCGSPTFFAG